MVWYDPAFGGGAGSPSPAMGGSMATPAPSGKSRFGITWDTNTGVAIILGVALAVLVGVHLAFRGVVVEIG